MPHPAHNLFNTHRTLEGEGFACNYYSLPALTEASIGSIKTLPVSLRILLESLLRNYDGHQITEEDIVNLANWNADSPKAAEIPFKPARVVAQDFTGVPLVVDIAAMRSAVAELGGRRKYDRTARPGRFSHRPLYPSRCLRLGKRLSVQHPTRV